MVALAQSVTIDQTTYPAGTDHTTMPPAIVDRIRNPAAWVGGTPPALNTIPVGKARLGAGDWSSAAKARAALGLGTAALLDVDQLDTDGGARINVKHDFGAQGDNSTDDTEALQEALDALPAGGGVVYLPAGTYLISDVLPAFNGLTLLGDGDGVTEIKQTATNKDAIAGSAVSRFTMQGISLAGPGSGTGSGVKLTKGANDAVHYVTIRDVTIGDFGVDGIAVENPIVSCLTRVLCQENGRYGFNLYGQTGGAAGTSTTLTACYGNANATAGIRLYNMVYSALVGCAADHNPVGHLFDTCQSVTATGCGAEGNTTAGFRVTGGYGATLAGAWVYDNRGIGIHITGTAHTVSVIAGTDNTPGGTATAFIKVDAGSQAALLQCNNTTANSLATGTTNVLTDSSGGAQFNAYTALLAGGEFDGDLTCWVANKGIVLTDRTSGGQYRLKVTSGVLDVEAV